MSLRNLWFLIDVVFWVGFFILEGFDFGVGMLHSFVARDDVEERIAINTIGPLWDGNEVWLIVAGAVIFAAFPLWYATMFSSFYLALVVLLVALMVRGVSFEYRRKFDDPRWRSAWKWSLTVGSALVPLLVGVALGDLLHGLPIDRAHNYTGSFWDLLVPYGLWTGITLVSLCLLMGVTFLTLKTTGELRARANRLSQPIALVAAVAVFGFMTWTHVGLGKGFIPNPIEVLATLAVFAAAWLAGGEHEGWTFTAAAIAIGGTVASIFAELFPTLMVSSTRAAYSVTVTNAASGPYTLKVMTVVALVFFPVVLVYQGWTLHVFRARLGRGPAPEADPARDGSPLEPATGSAAPVE